jgi:hypothetical protein
MNQFYHFMHLESYEQITLEEEMTTLPVSDGRSGSGDHVPADNDTPCPATCPLS